MDGIFDANEAKKLTRKAIEDASPENLKKIQEKIVNAAKQKRWNIIVDTDLLDSYTLEELRRKDPRTVLRGRRRAGPGPLSGANGPGSKTELGGYLFGFLFHIRPRGLGTSGVRDSLLRILFHPEKRKPRRLAQRRGSIFLREYPGGFRPV